MNNKSLTGTVKELTKMGLMIALVYVVTFVFKIPTPTGYEHLGDSMIFIAVIILGTKKGALAGAIGASLADFLGGYVIWIIPTFFIKLMMGLIMGIVIEKVLPSVKFNWLIGAILGGLFQIAGYAAANTLLFGEVYGLVQVAGIFIQTSAGLILATLFVIVANKSKVMEKLKEA